jgi:hypothetical protein
MGVNNNEKEKEAIAKGYVTPVEKPAKPEDHLSEWDSVSADKYACYSEM